MIFDKKGLKGNNFVHLILAAILILGLVYVFGSVNAGTMIGVLNVTNASGGQFNATFNIANGSEKLTKVNEDIMYRYNLSISHIAATRNLTGINITLPASFTFAVDSNATGNKTGTDFPIYFNATSSSESFSGSTLSWNATTGVTTAGGWIINASGHNNYTYIMFNATAATPGYYNITVRFIYNHTIINTALGYNETNMTIIVNDTTRPHEINVTGPNLNRSYANVSGSITINVSILDNGNFTANLSEYDVKGVNISFFNGSDYNSSYLATNMSGKYWNVTINTANIADGVYNITIAANDTLNNINITNISNVRIDNTAPTGSASCSPATVNTGDTITCSCSPSDATSGVNSSATSITANPSTTSTGTFTETCSFADLAGNSGTTTAQYTVEQGGGGASAGTSGSSATTGTVAKAQTFTKITPGVASIVRNFDAETGLKEIQIEVKNEAQNVKVSVTKYTSKPAAVSVEKAGKVFQYMQIKVDNVADKLEKAKISTKVKKTWVSDNALTKDKVALFKFDETAGKWNELTTTYASEDETYYYYDAEVASFSYFAIGERGVVEATPSGTGTTPSGEDTTTGTTAGGTNLTWLWIIIGVVVLAAIVWFVWSKKK